MTATSASSRLALLAISLTLATFAQTPGPNVNMVTGTEWPGGDPFLQRQNEPSLAVSSRNSLHLFGGANDYRTVDLPGLPGAEATGDAWLGLFKSFDGGQTWVSNLIPGYPQDTSAAGTKSPLKGFQAAADPTVRAGSNGLFFFSGIAFNRAPKTGSTVFVARFVDDNNETADTIRYLGTSTPGRGDDGRGDGEDGQGQVNKSAGNASGNVPFVDKPSLAVDIPRRDAGQCRIPDPSGARGPSIRAGNVYLAYTMFLGNSPTAEAQLLFARSTDCGATWSNPVKLSAGSRINQGSVIAIDPRNGAVYVVWRRFASTGQTDAILYARSTDGGQHFSDPAAISAITPFDQGDSSVSLRFNTFPAMAVDNAGRVYVAWSQLGAGPGGDARILYSMSSDGRSWSAPAAADPSAQRGHQIMPALNSNAGQITLLFYDLREDHTLGFYSPLPDGQLSETRLAVGYDPGNPADVASVFNSNIADAAPPLFTALLARRHTLDVRVAQVFPQTAPGFGPSVNVSQYLTGATPDDSTFRQLQVNPPNLPMFVQGTTPFMGDYIDLASQSIVPDGRDGWKYNDAPPASATTHAVWADNRDVRPPKDGDWTKYTPIRPTGVPSLFDPTQTVAACDPFRAGMRNQNIYTSQIAAGLVVASTGNSKQLDANLLRGFTVSATNTTTVTKAFRFTITAQPPGGMASFLQFPVVGSPFPLTYADVTVPPQSGASRTVFATSTDARAAIPVTVAEITAPGGGIVNGGLQGAVTLNADISNPNISNPNISNVELYNPNISNPNISNPNISNPNISNPNISNPNISNPTLSAVDLATPNISNPNISNPNISNPNISNPNISNPNISNSDLATPPVDTTWTLTNSGNTAASYSLKLLTSGFLPQNAKFQLLISRVNVSPTLSVDPITLQCQLGTQGQYLPFSNITSSVFSSGTTLSEPAALDSSPNSASVALAAGEQVQVTLRTFDAPPGFDPTSVITTAVVPQAANTGQSQPTIVASGPPIVTTTSPLPLAVVGSAYGLQLQASGGSGNLTWTGQNPPAGLFLSAGGLLTGTPTTPGVFVLTATVTDQLGRNSSLPLSLTVSATPVLALAPQSLPNATLGVPYSRTLTASGGTAPYAFGLAGGSGPLPPGITLNSNGLLSGTPTQVGAFGFTVQASDSAGNSQILGLSITVGATAGSSLAFQTAPTNIAVGQTLPPIQVLAHTPTNTPIAGVQVTLTVANNNPSGGRLTGNTTATTDANGIATFSGISIDRIGNYTLMAMVLGIEPSGSFQIVPVPSSVSQGTLESNSLISVFPEQLALTLPAPLSVNASVPGNYSSFAALSTSLIPQGTLVDSYYVHADPVGQPVNPVFQSASFTFPTQILGVQIFEPQLGSGDRFVGEPATQYFQGRALRIGNPQDSFVISPDGHSVSVNVANLGGTSDMRVIIASAQVSTNILVGNSSSFTVSPVPGLISTYAGKFPSYTPPGNGQATSASFGEARHTAVDASGNLYFADADLNLVFKVTTSGAISVVAGNGMRGFSGEGGLATNAALNRPYGLALDGPGNLYIGDTLNGAVRRVDAVTGIINTVAGGGPLFGQDNVPALETFLSGSLGLAFDPTNPNNLYVAENGGNRIRKIDLNTGLITTAAGTGTPGYNGDGISPTTAQLDFPWDVAFDNSGTMYIADTGNFRVRKVNGGLISTVAGTNVQAFSPDNVTASTAALCSPTGVTPVGADLLITDNCTNRIRRVSAGILTTVAGTPTRGFAGDGGPATSAILNGPTSASVDAFGNLYISDSGNTRIRKVTGGTITTYAGGSSALFGGDGGPATNALFNGPQSLALDGAANLYVGDANNFRVRQITPGGAISTYAGNGQLLGPLGDNGPATSATISGPGLALDASNNLYVVDTSQGQRIRKIAPGGTITTVAGNGLCCYAGDNGPATSARIAPAGVAVDTAGNLYISEPFDGRVRKVDISGTITTYAGNGTQGFAGDNGPAASALLEHPRLLVVDSAGNLYVSDQDHPRVRRITPGGFITTIAGTGTGGFTPDGSSALSPIFSPNGLGIDVAGNLYIANGGRVQKVDVNGIITTVAGNGTFGFAGDGAPAKEGALESGGGVVVDANGDIYIGDGSNQRIRLVTGFGPLTPGSRLTITTTSLTAPLNTPFAASLNHAGGTGALTFTLAGGSLPTGLNIDASGNITGTPTVAGTYSALIQLTDSGSPQQTTGGFVQIQVQ